MNQDDSPALAGFGEASPAPTTLPAPVNVSAKPSRSVNPVAADPFAVGVRVLRMAPAVMVAMTVCSSALILLLGWMNAGGTARVVAHPAALNDARQSRTLLTADAAGKAAATNAPNSTQPVKAAPAPENNPAPAAAQAPAPATPAAQQPAPQTPSAPPAAEKAQSQTPAPPAEAAGKFTIQVGSFNSQSEANERVSKLRSAGFESRAVAVEIQGRGTWYRVQVGRYADRDAASKVLADVRVKGAAAGAIVVAVQN